MQRLGELNNKVIVEQKYAPENKHVIWKDPAEDKFKEFKDGQWVESNEIAVPSEGGDFPYQYIQIPDVEYTITSDISKIEEKIDNVEVDLSNIYCIIGKNSNKKNICGIPQSGTGLHKISIATNGSGSTKCELQFYIDDYYDSYSQKQYYKNDIYIYGNNYMGGNLDKETYSLLDAIGFYSK